MGNKALTNDATPVFDWADVTAANLYHCQVSLYADFYIIEDEDAALATSTFTMSAPSVDDRKYYWRWRSSADAGTTWGAWSENYSFWFHSHFTADVTPTTWMIVNPSVLALTDSYSFGIYPLWKVTPQQINLAMERNLAGDLLIDNVTVKDRITCIFNDAYISSAQRSEFYRFYRMGTSFFLLGAQSNGTEVVEKVWKVVFEDIPDFDQLAAGREDYFTGTLTFIEV